MKKKILTIPILLTLLGLLVFSSFFFKERRAILDEPPTSWRAELKADCAIVLTGGAGRVREGIDLLAKNWVRKLIISGVYPNATLRDVFPLWPVYGDLKEENVILEYRSNTTYGNAQQSLPLVEVLHCKDIALITSQRHMFRAYQTFQSAFPSSIRIYKHTIPSSRVENGFLETSTEVLKSLFYGLWAY